MFRQILPLVVAACVAPCFATDGWIVDDMATAKKQAAEQNKGILIEFTGSDWCPPCKALRAGVLTTPEFIAEAGKNFVLLELDYPREKPQTPEVKANNEKLAGTYGVEGFPTVVFADADGKPMGGFVGGRPKDAVMAAMADAMKNKDAIKAAEAKVAAATTDDAKIAALVELLKLVPSEYVDGFYAEVKKQLMDLDTEDKSGYRAAEAHKAKVESQKDAVSKYLQLHLSGGSTPEKMLAAVKAYPDRDKLEPEVAQQFLMVEFGLAMNTGDVDGGLAILSKVIEMDPKSEVGQQAAMMKPQIEADKDKIKKQIEEAKARRNAASNAQ